MGLKGFIEVENLIEILIVDVKEVSWLYLKGFWWCLIVWINVNDIFSRLYWYIFYLFVVFFEVFSVFVYCLNFVWVIFWDVGSMNLNYYV